MRPSPFAFALWGAFAMVVAYTYGLRLLLAGGIVMLMLCLTMIVARATGVDLGVVDRAPGTAAARPVLWRLRSPSCQSTAAGPGSPRRGAWPGRPPSSSR